MPGATAGHESAGGGGAAAFETLDQTLGFIGRQQPSVEQAGRRRTRVPPALARNVVPDRRQPLQRLGRHVAELARGGLPARVEARQRAVLLQPRQHPLLVQSDVRAQPTLGHLQRVLARVPRRVRVRLVKRHSRLRRRLALGLLRRALRSAGLRALGAGRAEVSNLLAQQLDLAHDELERPPVVLARRCPRAHVRVHPALVILHGASPLPVGTRQVVGGKDEVVLVRVVVVLEVQLVRQRPRRELVEPHVAVLVDVDLVKVARRVRLCHVHAPRAKLARGGDKLL
mmetsp:Transcript_28153/g.48205  ORF Transcript_28153/g.48205 Transcript_28153/m.48205 type:complete len:285 (-) Transcript_28153:463-1317(-)